VKKRKGGHKSKGPNGGGPEGNSKKAKIKSKGPAWELLIDMRSLKREEDRMRPVRTKSIYPLDDLPREGNFEGGRISE